MMFHHMFVIYLFIICFSSFERLPTATTAEPLANTIDINAEAVRIHNSYRAKHGVPPLKFSQAVADVAQNWANELALRGTIEHRPNNPYGENLYMLQSSGPTVLAKIADACESWYSEIKTYNFVSNHQQPGTGHFTQMIWRTTRELGIGVAKSKSGLQIIVANYNPPGNYIGQYKINVPRPVNNRGLDLRSMAVSFPSPIIHWVLALVIFFNYKKNS